jgi:hypothetical protein
MPDLTNLAHMSHTTLSRETGEVWSKEAQIRAILPILAPTVTDICLMSYGEVLRRLYAAVHKEMLRASAAGEVPSSDPL